MVNKNMLIGALVTGITDAALEGYYTYMDAQGRAPSGQFPYMVVPGAEWLPPLDDWIASAGVPGLLYVLGKYMKKPALIQMAKGGGIYGAGTLVGITAVRVSLKAQGRIALPATYQVVR